MAASVALGVAATVALVGPVLSGQTAVATPESDAQDAITAAWQAAGGDASPLGATKGDAYPIGAGFAQDFVGGKMFFTPGTGARALYGAILEKYESLGGAATSDLGFPNIDEVPGLVSADSRVATFAAADNPVIFWTPDHGAYVVRGPINAGWDKLGSSTGALGVPAGDESYDGPVVTQKFSGGQLSFNSGTKAFTTVPPDLAAQLADLQVQGDPIAAIDQAWRAAGGVSGPLGAKQGDQHQVGNDGAGQDFAGGKVYFSPATGAGAVEGDILAKYESLGGPAGSDLGFPVGNETDGGIPGSRVSKFSADDEPIIFFTPDNGAFVVRSAMKTAWDKLGGASGKLGAPLGDQTVDGDVVSQKFSGGKVAWKRATNTFSTDPADLAKSLSGLQIPGLQAAGPSRATPGAATGGGSHWRWWWLPIGAVALAVLGALGWTALGRQRRRSDADSGTAPTAVIAQPGDDIEAEDQWSSTDEESDTTVHPPNQYDETAGSPPGVDLLSQSTMGEAWAYAGTEADDSDDVDTAPTRIPSETELATGRHAVIDDQDESGAELHIPQHDESMHPMMHLPLDDPYQPPEGYPVKANVASGLYYTAESPLYDDTLAEIWFATEEAAELNGFIKAR